MEENQVKIWYLHHSGFAVEVQDHFLVFDYSLDNPKDNIRSLENGVISPEDLKSKRNVYVFVSHSHKDHFNPVIFDWSYANPNIKYVLSYDIKFDLKQFNFHHVLPYQAIKIGRSVVKTFGSTDVGVSFLVEIDGLGIFHAGDLNCWYWYYESTPEELEQDKNNYIKEIEKIKGEKIDIAFFPVDPRLKEYYHMGGEHFIKTLKPKLFIPMHFWNKYKVTGEFAEKVKDLPCRVESIKHRGQQIIYSY